ncbi:hypothetical protein KKG48_00705 [Patescibacteria group bacterium]|nr:hypothetical protein [Patescibacteria group bacterium]MCG2694715.1 hypothetical protein [Candidatus Parcubacteria bacterium]
MKHIIKNTVEKGAKKPKKTECPLYNLILSHILLKRPVLRTVLLGF